MYEEDEDDVLAYLVKQGAITQQQAENVRRRRAAEALRDTPYQDGKMVSGHYIPTSRWQDIATLGRQLAGVYGTYRADRADEEIARKRSEALDELIRRVKGGTRPRTFTRGYGLEDDGSEAY
jgi:hypothetical protein